MKRIWILPLLAALVLLLPACGKEETAPTVPAATVRATRDQATRSTVASTTAAPTTAPATTVPSTTKKTEPTTAPTTKVAATSKPVQDGIPADTITAGNINPNLSAIQGYVQSEVNALAVTGVSLSRDSVVLESGESVTVDVMIEPSYANHKNCAVHVSSDCAKASFSSGVLTIIAQKEGSGTVTVTTHNGLTATCAVTVHGTPEDKPTPPPADEPTTQPEAPTTVAEEEPTE